ncbi:hypothetical protein [Mycetocola sp.]|uniref:hypothetical protein n=1 Tax=Mycetocola sp. TaxID=1871042 RepID=UPI003988D7BA
MNRLQLSLACGEYEILRALADGDVRPDGIDLTVLNHDKERIFRLDRRNECDVAEFNIVQYLKARDAGEPLVALPVFPHRRFRHGSIFVNTEAGITGPDDLRGKAMGIGGFEPAAAVWIRGILRDQYGIGHDEIDWQDVYGRLGRLPDGQREALKPGQTATRQSIDELVLDGTLAGIASAYIPQAFVKGDPRIGRLFPDYAAVERDYFQTFGIFPTMHVLTIKSDIVEKHPWVPASLFQAFTLAKKVALDRLHDPRYLPLAFLQSVQEEQAQLLGEDPWAYGLTSSNRLAVDAVNRYCLELGLITDLLSLDDLFIETDDYSGAKLI